MCVGIRAYSAGKSPSFEQPVLAGMALLSLGNVLNYFTVLGAPGVLVQEETSGLHD